MEQAVSTKKYWRVELDNVTRYATYIVADTLEAARAIAITVEADEVQEESTEWLEVELSEVDEDEALNAGLLFRPSDDEDEE
jgi:hypothetical protein